MKYAMIVGIGTALAAGSPVLAASPGGLETLYTFSGGADGGQPGGQLVPGPGHTLFGTTQSGGASSAGTVFQIKPGQHGGTLTTLYSFAGGNDGATPTNIIADGHGNLFGVTTAGGGSANCSGGCGTVFELSPSGNGGWTETVLHAFQSSPDGMLPNGVAMDGAGNLFGFALLGGTGECKFLKGYLLCGTAFELSPPAQQGQDWNFQVIYTFLNDRNGAGPFGPPVIARDGALFGTTAAGGYGTYKACGPQIGCGFVFKLEPPGHGGTSWTRKVIYYFHGPDGNGGYDPVVADGQGNLYGMTNEGGPSNPLCPEYHKLGIPAGCGVAFELTPPAKGRMWNYVPIWKFTYGPDGAYPANSPLTFDHGAWFATSSGPDGAVVEFLPPQNGQTAWTEKTLFAFSNDANGAQPEAGVTALGGALYGTTAGLGQAGSWGTVFRITP